jgi:predicted NBD/HSP70 family sugar kinase
VGLPGLIARYKDQHMQPGSFILGQDRGLRNNMGRTLRDDIGRDVAVMSGAEANGFGEMAYGAGRGEKGLTMMLTLGTGFGVALFDDGVLVNHIKPPVNHIKSPENHIKSPVNHINSPVNHINSPVNHITS